jgi:putative FmdB family regulatory protein
MPLYTYNCSEHGEFGAWAPMEQSDAPQPCPTCAAGAPRALARPMVAKGDGSGDAGESGCAADGCGMGMCGMPSGGHVCGAGCTH